MSTARRAAPLPPEARRASIIAAALPLIRIHGTAVTTAQIAMAAGIAEGTLFRVFPDKDTLISAALQTAFDPAPAERELAAIDPDLGLRDRLIAAVDILRRRVEAVWQLMAILGPTAPPVQSAIAARPTPAYDGSLRLIATLFEAHRDELRCEPAHAARLLRMMAFAGSHPKIHDGTPLTSAEVVAVLLDGIRVRPEPDPPEFSDAPGAGAEATC
ncbi:MAG TPA: TetR family transcriptional regulator [Kofleriaceae bacterium]|nr:TetR family transcriptional regulator [Kofleriaceae bacterium]